MHIVKTQDVYTLFRWQAHMYPAGMAVLALPESHKEEKKRPREWRSQSMASSFLLKTAVYTPIKKVFEWQNWWVSSSPDENFVRRISSQECGEEAEEAPGM